MAHNPYMDIMNVQGEKDLEENLFIEAIEAFGVEVWYLPRTLINVEELYYEPQQVIFESAKKIDVYIKEQMGFAGGGDILTKFGIQIRDECTLQMSVKVFREIFADVPDYHNPHEGDLIVLVLDNELVSTKRMYFQIKFIQDEAMFYPLGRMIMYEFSVELFDLAGELFRTGNPKIDSINVNYPVSNVATTAPDDTATIETREGGVIDWSEDNPFSEDF